MIRYSNNHRVGAGAPASGKVLRALSMALVAGLLAFGPAAAQEEAPGVFGEVIDVRVVNLEVVVVDRDGVRVNGLKPQDFVLRVDGREVPIEYFTEVHGGTAVVRGDEGEVHTLPALAPGEAVGTSYLVYIDEFFSRSTDRNRVLNGMIEQLPLLNTEDRMAVVAFDGKKLEMLSTWSNEVETLTRVLEKARERPAQGLKREAELRSYTSLRDVRDVTRTAAGTLDALNTRLDVDEQYYADLVASQVERSVLAASAALRSFARPPGRKVMILLSGGWPYNPAQWVVEDSSRALLATDVDHGTDLYGPLIETANRLSYTLYPVDVPTFDTPVVDLADTTPPDQTLLFERERDEEATLSILARETGGRAMLNSAGVEAFERAVEDTRSYYWLGFTPTWKGDDASHKVRLETRDKRYKVRSRRGFSDLSRQTEVTMMVESSLLFGNPPSAAPLTVQLGAPKRGGWGKVLVPLKIAIPLHALTFLPAEGGWVAETELRIAVLDEDGNTSDVPVIPVVLKGPRQPEEEAYKIYEAEIKMRKKHHDLVVSLYDLASGTILSTKLEFDPEDRSS